MTINPKRLVNKQNPPKWNKHHTNFFKQIDGLRFYSITIKVKAVGRFNICRFFAHCMDFVICVEWYSHR